MDFGLPISLGSVLWLSYGEFITRFLQGQAASDFHGDMFQRNSHGIALPKKLSKAEINIQSTPYKSKS